MGATISSVTSKVNDFVHKISPFAEKEKPKVIIEEHAYTWEDFEPPDVGPPPKPKKLKQVKQADSILWQRLGPRYCLSDAPDPPLRILERKDLGLKKPKWRQRLKTPVFTYVLRYFTKTPECENDDDCIHIIRELQDKHMGLGMPDIAYNFLISTDGTVYEGRGWETKSTKEDYETIKFHGKSIDIALIGDHKTTYPSEEMNKAACRLMQKGVKLGHADQGWEVVEVREDTPHSIDNIQDLLPPDEDPKIYEDLKD